MKKNAPLWKGFLAQLGRRSPSNLNPSESSSSNLNLAESIASTSSDSVRNNGNRVFLSFRGADTRNTFVDHLYAHLTRKGICVFKDDISLRKGDPISPQLMQAIKDSHVSVVVFSKDYAASTWCLEEMAVVADCKQEANQTVFSVFYDVDPSHVRHQSGPYKKPFVKHISEFKKEPHKVHRWKRAMEDLASSAGWDVRNKMVDRSLITLRDEEIYMHEMLKELGKKIVRSQHLHEPERWSRLWLYKDFSRVLTTDLGANNVQAIVLDKREDITECSMEGMSRMKNLRLLILYHSTFSGSLDYLSPKLRYLLWNDYPFNSLPSNFIAIDLVELNMPNSSIRSVWEGRKKFPNMKRIDLSNSKYLGESPDFSEIPKLERLDLSGCTSLSQVHPSIGLLEKLTFLSLQNCNNLVSINFDKKSNIRSLRVLLLCGCTKLENTPDFTSATNLKYLDMDGCTSLSLIDESIGSLANLRYLNLRDCKNVVTIPDTIITMWSLQTLDLRGCLKLMNLPLGITVNASYLMPLIFLDISFCNLLELPDAIGRLMCLERMNLQGNNFVSIPDLLRLGRLAYLNLSHCSKLECLPQLPLNNDTPAGRYFKTVSGSRDHRSGLYAFDCPEMDHNFQSLEDEYLYHYWLARLIREPNHFRCGFDIVLPWDLVDTSLMWFEGYKIFDGCPVIRLNGFSEVDSWLGFSFCVLFEVKKGPAVSSFSHHPFYLSFESEYTEEYFDMPLNLEVDNIDESRYAWMIYISKEHCHFVKSGAHITFKGHPHVEICRWGIRSIFVQDIDGSGRFKVLGARPLSKHYIDFDYVKNSNNSFGPKIQLPYNWLVTDEDEAENINAKAKGKGLSYAGL